MLSRLKDFLDFRQVSYEVTAHPEAHHSQDVAALLHQSGKQFARVIMVRIESGFVMCVLPAHELIDMERLEKLLGEKGTVRIATEEEIKNLFPDGDIEAIPPFGNLYDLPVYLDQRLAQYDDIYFEAGSPGETATLRMDDYRRLVSPKISEFGRALRQRKAA